MTRSALLFVSAVLVTFQLRAANAPVANADTAKVPKNSQGTVINVLANDAGAGLRITAVTQGEHGTVTFTNSTNQPPAGAVNAISILLYAPARDYVGPDNFTYTITDSTGATATGEVAVQVEAPAPPPAPVAKPDTAKVLKNSAPYLIYVLSNDVGVGLRITAITPAEHGTVTLASSTNVPANTGYAVMYKPNTDYVGPDQFTYTITDANGATAVGNVAVQVDPAAPAPPPIANPDFAKVAKNSANNFINVLQNDGGVGLVITAVTQGEHGSVKIVTSTVAANGIVASAVQYKPAADYAGPDRFTYTITNTAGVSATGNVTISVEAPQLPPPVAKPDFAKVKKNSVNNPINVLANDTGTGLRITAVTQGEHGTVTIPENGPAANAIAGVQYTPTTDYVGQDHFTYVVTDAGGATATGTVSILVEGPTTPPPPIANPDFVRVLKNTSSNPIHVLANDVGAGLSLGSVSQPEHGTVTIAIPLNGGAGANIIGDSFCIYMPNHDYVGPDKFTYAITDANGGTATGTVNIQVDGNTTIAPAAKPDFAKVLKNSKDNVIDVLKNDTGAHLTITAVTQGEHGKVEIPATIAVVGAVQVLFYTPDTDYVGEDRFTYTVTDSSGATATGNVSILVEELPTPPKPVANPDFAKVPKNSAHNFINVLLNDKGTLLRITAVTQGAHGAVEIVNSVLAGANFVASGVNYKPDTDYVGPDEFTYTVTDPSGATAVGKVSILVAESDPPPPPPKPIANPDFAKVAKNSTNNVIKALSNDVGANLSISAVTQGEHGSVEIPPIIAVVGAVQVLLYTPDVDYVGPDKFTYTITGADNLTATGTVTIYVSDENTGPRAQPDFATTQKNSSGVDIPVLANDVGAGLTIAEFTQPENGTVTASANSMGLMYVPKQDFVGLDRFKYTAADANGQKASAEVSVLVVNTKPSRVLAQASPPVAAPGETIAFFAQLVSDVPVNSVVFSWDFGDGSSAKGQNTTHAYAAAGTYTATVTATSGNNVLGTATVTVLVKGTDGAPIARFTISDVAAIAGTPITFDASASFDPGNAIVKYDWDFGDGSAHGDTVVVSHIYELAGAYSVTLTVTDEQGLSDSATRMIQVLDKNAGFRSRVRYIAKLNFAANAADTLQLSAMLKVGDTPVAAGTEVGCSVAGVSFSGVLDKRLQDTSSPNERWVVKSSGPARARGDVFLQLTVKRASLARAFAAAGAVPGNDPGEPDELEIPVTLSIADRSVDLLIKTKVVFSRNANRAVATGEGP